MEPSRYQQSEEKDASKIEEFLNAVRDIQSINVDNIWPHLSQGSEHSYPGIRETLSHPSVRALESQNESLRKELELEKEFKQEYFKVFGKKEMKDVNRTMDHMEDEIKKLQEENTKLYKTIKGLEEDVRKAVTEKNNAMTRFNQQMKIQVTDNTTDISDMCDETRPNKLGERYRNLYDTLWADAFELLIGEKRCTEENCIQMLLQLLIECHNFAKMRADKQMTELVRIISGDSTMQAGDALIGQLKAARKLMNVARADLLYQECERHVRDNVQVARCYLHEKEMKMYLIECFQICWLMAIQDPPLVLGKEAKYADAFNLEFYNHYTKYGNRIKFVVWPPLLLDKGGPVLTKGVAQPIQEKNDSERKYAWGIRNVTGQREQPRGRTTEQDLMLSSIRDSDDPMLWMRTQSPPTPRSTSASTSAQHFHPTGEQKRNIISTHVGYDMYPTETYYSCTNVDLNEHERFTSALECGTKTHVTAEDVLNSSQRTRSRHVVDVRGQNNVDSTAEHTRRNGLAYEPLKRHEEQQFRNFQIRLGLYGVDYAKSIYGRKFDRFYALLRRGTAE